MPDNTLEVPDLVGNSNTEENEDMSNDIPPNLHSLLQQRTFDVGAQGQQHFVNYGKVLDFDYAEGKRVIGMTESMGVREVSSDVTPGGPNRSGN